MRYLAKRLISDFRWGMARRRFLRRALLALGGWAALCLLLGYRLPGFDRHPEWPELPQVTNPRFVIETIPDTTFDKQYGQRFQRPIEFSNSSKDYAASIRNVRFLDYQVMSNEFHSGISFKLYLGGNSTIRTDPYPTPTMRFSQRGHEYYELMLGKEKACFKDYYYSPFPPLLLFYQYNYPRSEQDTLFLYSTPHNYRIYLRNSVQTR